MAYRRESQTYRQRGVINPFLQEIRNRGFNVSSDEFWKVVKRYERFNKKLKKHGLFGINPFAETLVFFTEPEKGFEFIRVNTLQVRNKRYFMSAVIARDLQNFRLKYSDMDLKNKITLGERREWLEWFQLTYNNPNLTWKDIPTVTLDDFFVRFGTDEKLKKKDLYRAIEYTKRKANRSPQFLGVGS